MRRPWVTALLTPNSGGWSWPLADWASCPKSEAGVLRHRGMSSALLFLQADRLTGRWSDPRPPHWGDSSHFSLVLSPTSPASFQKFLFLILASPCDLQGLPLSRRLVHTCWGLKGCCLFRHEGRTSILSPMATSPSCGCSWHEDASIRAVSRALNLPHTLVSVASRGDIWT